MRGKIADRAVQISILEKYITHLRDVFEADAREKDAALQLLIKHLYDRTLSIQQEIVDRLNAFTAERQKAAATINAEVANLEGQINFLKAENERDASILNTITNAPSWME